MKTEGILRQLIHSTMDSAAGLKRIQKDRQRRPWDQKRKNSQKHSATHRDSESEPDFLIEDIPEEIHLRNDIGGTCYKSKPGYRENRMAEAREPKKRIDIVI